MCDVILSYIFLWIKLQMVDLHGYYFKINQIIAISFSKIIILPYVFSYVHYLTARFDIFWFYFLFDVIFIRVCVMSYVYTSRFHLCTLKLSSLFFFFCEGDIPIEMGVYDLGD